MARENMLYVCLNVRRPETVIPMIALRYSGD
jgi:hypothetical protein